jgi:hypothetical protein
VQEEEDVRVNGDANVLFAHQSRVAWEEWDGKDG